MSSSPIQSIGRSDGYVVVVELWSSRDLQSFGQVSTDGLNRVCYLCLIVPRHDLLQGVEGPDG